MPKILRASQILSRLIMIFLLGPAAEYYNDQQGSNSSTCEYKCQHVLCDFHLVLVSSTKQLQQADKNIDEVHVQTQGAQDFSL